MHPWSYDPHTQMCRFKWRQNVSLFVVAEHSILPQRFGIVFDMGDSQPLPRRVREDGERPYSHMPRGDTARWTCLPCLRAQRPRGLQQHAFKMRRPPKPSASQAIAADRGGGGGAVATPGASPCERMCSGSAWLCSSGRRHRRIHRAREAVALVGRAYSVFGVQCAGRPSFDRIPGSREWTWPSGTPGHGDA